jgi:hypothetical protein
MKTAEAAGILDVSDEQVARLCKAGRLPGSKLVRRGKRNRGWRWEVSGVSVRVRKRALAKRGR